MASAERRSPAKDSESGSPRKEAAVRRGSDAERLAEEFLVLKSFSIVERNYRIRNGEIDLIAVDGKTLVFVEVKSLKYATPYHPEEQVTPAKRRKLIATAREYLSRTSGTADCRFDVIAIIGDHADIVHFEDAFNVED